MGHGLVLSLSLYALLALVIAGVGLYLVGAFNQMVRSSREVDRAFSNIEVSLKQRHDELPNLVELCRAYMAHERGVMERVIELRRQFDVADRVDSKVDAENRLGRDLGLLLAVAEGYPDLKADEHFAHLEARLSGLENQIAGRRELFNAAVTAYNTYIEALPALVLAKGFGFRERPLLELGDGHREHPLGGFE